MGGDVRASGLIEFTPDNSLVMKLDVTAIDLAIPTIFKQCENFGQTTLTDKHLKGTVSILFFAFRPGLFCAGEL